MATNTDYLRFTHEYLYQGETLLNVFYWQLQGSDGLPVTLDDLVQSYAIKAEIHIMSQLVDSLMWTKLTIDNLSDPNEFFEGVINIPGDDADEGMPSFVTVGVKLLRSTKITRAGYKRFTGIAQSNENAGVINYTPAEVDLIEDFCGQPQTIALTENPSRDVILAPMIIGRTKDANGVYQLDLSRVNAVNGAQVQSYLGSQNTRKPN